jgi:hypothetical protein
MAVPCPSLDPAQPRKKTSERHWGQTCPHPRNAGLASLVRRRIERGGERLWQFEDFRQEFAKSCRHEPTRVPAQDSSSIQDCRGQPPGHANTDRTAKGGCSTSLDDEARRASCPRRRPSGEPWCCFPREGALPAFSESPARSLRAYARCSEQLGNSLGRSLRHSGGYALP